MGWTAGRCRCSAPLGDRVAGAPIESRYRRRSARDALADDAIEPDHLAARPAWGSTRRPARAERRRSWRVRTNPWLTLLRSAPRCQQEAQDVRVLLAIPG